MNNIDAVAQLIEKAQRIFIFTGAGISTESGIPDYRGPKGVWKTEQPILYDDFMNSEKARMKYWLSKKQWWETHKDTQPNSVHTAIVRLEQMGKLELLVTQNIDGLHSKAGTSKSKLVEIHGTNREVECQDCGERSDPEKHYTFIEQENRSPLCHCGGILKPATISFGQNLTSEEICRAEDGARNADCVIAMGSTLSVYPAAALPLMASRGKNPYCIINYGNTDHDSKNEVTLRIEGKVGDLFPQAVDKAWCL